jgi:hypothetical protein
LLTLGGLIGRQRLSAEEIEEQPEHQGVFFCFALLLLFWLQS